MQVVLQSCWYKSYIQPFTPEIRLNGKQTHFNAEQVAKEKQEEQKRQENTHAQSGQHFVNIAFPQEMGHFYGSTFVKYSSLLLVLPLPMETISGTHVQVDHILAMSSTTVTTVNPGRKDKVQNASDQRTQSFYCPGFLVFLLEAFEWVFSSLFEWGLVGNCSPNPLGPFRKTHWK